MPLMRCRRCDEVDMRGVARLEARRERPRRGRSLVVGHDGFFAFRGRPFSPHFFHISSMADVGDLAARLRGGRGCRGLLHLSCDARRRLEGAQLGGELLAGEVSPRNITAARR